MTKKNRDAASHLPSDDFTMTDGINYGLDGFDFDMDYGAGLVSDAVTLPEAFGLSGLPDGTIREGTDLAEVPQGVVRAEDEGADLSEMLKEGSLSGLGWLHGEQDPERLPNQREVIPQLEEAWGADRRTQGLVPNVERVIEPYAPGEAGGPPFRQASKEDLQRVIQRAMRRSAYGDPLDLIMREAAEELGKDTPRIASAMKQVKAEHGLVGNVYLRASAFPGLHNGKWKNEIRRKCSGARYLIADEGSTLGDIVKMEVVASVPWDEALAYYKPKLAAAGYKVATSGSPEAILRAAFLSQPEKVKTHIDRTKPIEVRAVDRVSREQAWQEYRHASKPEQEVIDLSERQATNYRKKVRLQVAKWVQAGLLTKKDGMRLVNSKAPSQAILKAAASVVFSHEDQTYKGAGEGALDTGLWPDASTAWASLRQAEKKVSAEQTKIERSARGRVEAAIHKMVRGDLITDAEGAAILDKNASAQASIKMAVSLAMAKSQRQYEGAGDGVLSVPDASRGQIASELANHATPQAVGTSKCAHCGKEITRRAGQFCDSACREGFLINRHVGELRQGGLVTRKEAAKLVSLKKPLQETMALASALIAQRQRTPMKVSAQTEAPVYYGAGNDVVAPPKMQTAEAREELRQAQVGPRVSEREIQRIVRWASQHLNQGMAGNDFDDLLRTRFSEPMIKAAASRLNNLRDEHEGLAGYLYIDAAAYASPQGTTGCDQGGLQHRANQIKFVLAMDRCAGCTSHNADGLCQKYNKTLAKRSDLGDEAKAIQQENLRLANATDQEQTAAMFDQGEFNLHNSALEGFDIEDEPERANVDGIFFGGMDIGEGS